MKQCVTAKVLNEFSREIWLAHQQITVKTFCSLLLCIVLVPMVPCMLRTTLPCAKRACILDMGHVVTQDGRC